MGGIYSTNDKSNANIRQNNGNSLINFSSESSQINSGAYTSAFHPSSIAAVNRSNQNDLTGGLNGAFARGLNANIAANHGSFAMAQNQRPREKDLPILNNEELMNYRYMTEGNPFQAARNISMSPNSVLSSQFKHQNYSHGHAHGPGHAAHGLLMNSPLQQQQARQPGAVLSQMTVSKGDGLQPGGGASQLHQSCSKLSADVSNRVNSSAYQLAAPHMSQPGLFQANKRLQLLSQPPNKRPRLSHDFTNIGAAAAAAAAHQTTNSMGQTSHFLALGGHGDNGKKLSTSPHKQQIGQQTQIHHHPTQQQHSLSHNQQQQQTQHNIALYNKGNVSSNGVWSNKEPSYYPQVEAISPVQDEMRHGDLKNITEKDDIGEKLRDLEDEIIKQQELVNRLKDKTDYLNNKINQPNIDTSIKEEDPLVPLSRDPIQLIIANNQRKATEQHQFFQKFCGEHVSWHPLALPIYKQPSDIELVMNIKNNFHKTFKPLLTKYIRRRKLAEIARLKVLAQDYEVSAKAWYKRLEKFENSAKRRQKELKYREQFEKVFPEIKRNREEKEKDSTDLGDGFSLNYENNNNNNNGAIVTNSFANTRSVSHSCNGANVSEQVRSHTPYDSVKEIEKMREYAIDPPIILPSWNKNFGLADCARLVKDPKHRHATFQSYKNNWSREEVEIFKEQYINTPKNFGRISTFLPKKTASDCIQYYYLTKKKANYKALVKKNARRRRVQAERQQRFRGETDHSNIGPIQQSTSDLHIDNGSSQPDNSLKVEPLLSNNFGEIDNNQKEPVLRPEQPRSLYNSEITNQQTGKYCVDGKNGAQQTSDFSDKKNSSQEQTTKTNKESNVSCSDRNSFRNSRDSDSDGNDEVHRFNPPTECLTVASSSSQFNKTSNNESDYKSDKEKHSDKCSDSYYLNTSKQSSQTNYKLDSKSTSNSIGKQDFIQIKDAIEYSIEQNLSQCSDNKREINTFQMIDNNNYRTDQYGDKTFKNFDNLSIFQNINIEDIHNANESYKNTYLSQNTRENSAFQEVKKDLANKSLDKSILINSTVNRKILMKDFCTAQIINHVPINGTIHSKSSPISFQKTPTTSNFIDPFINENSNKSINVMNKKSDFFIDRVSKLYEEEVEPYTDEFRNRSDSQRTRTSSEASQMYAYIKDRSLKNENRLRNALPLKSYSDKKAFTMTDSRLKMPPPDITDQKVFRSQKSSISKKNPYSKTTSKDCDINENETVKNKIIIDDSIEDDLEENTEKRKVVTAANILNSITDKNSYCNEDVKLITPPNKIGDIFKTNEILGENQKNNSLKNSIMTLDGHIKQNLSEKRLSNFIYQNKNEYCKKNFTVPLKKRDKTSLSDDHNVKVINTSPILTSNIKKVKHVPDQSSDSLSKYYFEKNNNIVSKEKLDVDTDENYDSGESPRFNSPGKLLIDLGNNSDGN